MKRKHSRENRSTIIYAMLSIIVVLVIIQLWLLTATMNAYLGGEEVVIWPAFGGSAVCFLLNLGLLWNLYAMERGGE